MNRREWIAKSGIAAGALLVAPSFISCIRESAKGNNHHILLVSGWQTVNIGDIAHTPGLIHLLKTYFPEIKITLWPNDIDLQEEKMLRTYFPDLTIVNDDFARTGEAGSEEAYKAIDDADFMLHGSGPGIVGLKNLKYAEEDHAKLREVIVRYVRETGNKVVLCPEMEYQTELYEPYLYNPLPSDVKDHILMHPYWQPDDAASLYARAAAVVSAECHSPIIALVNGTPAIYVRQPSDTIKGHMYYDLKLDDWIFEIEETTGTQIADRVMKIVENLDQSLENVKLLNKRVKDIYEGNMDVLRKYLA